MLLPGEVKMCTYHYHLFVCLARRTRSSHSAREAPAVKQPPPRSVTSVRLSVAFATIKSVTDISYAMKNFIPNKIYARGGSLLTAPLNTPHLLI